jgi:hypothetical protein
MRMLSVVLAASLLALLCGAGSTPSPAGDETSPLVVAYVLTGPTGGCDVSWATAELAFDCPCQVDNVKNWLQGCFTSGTWPCSCMKWTPDPCVRVEIITDRGFVGYCDLDTGGELVPCCFYLEVRFTASICCDSHLCYGEDWAGRCCPGGGSAHHVRRSSEDACAEGLRPNPSEPLIYNVGSSNPQVSNVWASIDVACTLPPPTPQTAHISCYTECVVGGDGTAVAALHGLCEKCQ